MSKTISITTPSLNQAQFIEETITSIISQEGDFFIDYIIADSGSTDGSVEIIKKYKNLLESKKYPIRCRGVKLRYWSKKDRGQSDAINQGFKVSNGEILAWLGSDDYYLPGAFDIVARAFEADKALDFIYGKVNKVDNRGLPIRETIPDPRENESFESLLTRGNSFGTQSTFMSRRILDKVGFVDESLHYCLDLDLWMRIFKYGKVKYIPKTMSVFRIWENSKTHTMKRKFKKERGIIAKRYGGNMIPSSFIYRMRGRFSILDRFKYSQPYLYGLLKRFFYKTIDLFRYSRTE